MIHGQEGRRDVRFYEMTVAGCRRKLPLCPIGNGMYIAAFVILGDPELTIACARELLKRLPEHDVLVTPECKSIPLAHELARLGGEDCYVVARKQSKIYMRDVLYAPVRSITTDCDQILCLDGQDAAYLRGKRVLLLDDVVSTGGSIQALEQLVVRAGGIIVGRAAVLAEGDAAKRKDLIYLDELPLFDPEGNPLYR